MTDLADRIEALTGPCRETDALIWLTINRPDWRKQKGWKKTNGWASEDRPSSMVSYYTPDGLGGSHTAQPYTASIDAAMSLVPEGAKLTFQNHGDVGGRSMWLVSPNERFVSAATPALALCAAAIRAQEK